MPVLRPSQNSFAAGELSPDLYSRTDLDKYKIGLKTCRNFIIHPHGDSSNRGGFRYITSTKYSDRPAYMRKFIFSRSQAYTLEFGDFYIRFNTNRTPIMSMGVPYEVVTPYAIADVPNLRFEQSADTLYIFHENYQQRTLVRNGEANWAINLYTVNDGPFLNENIDVSSTLASTDLTGVVTLGSADDIFSPQHVGALWKLVHYMQGNDYTDTFTGTGTGSGISCFTTWRVITHGTWTGKFNIEKSIDAGTTWTILRTFSSANDFNANTFGTEDPTIDTVPFLIRINVTVFSSGSLNVDLTTDPFYQTGIVRIATYISATSVTANVLQAIGLIDPTYTWSEGAWSDYRGYPSHGRFYQDRLCQSSSRNDPDTNWLSRSGNYTSYGVFDPLQDSDAIDIPLPSRQLNSINGLIAFAQLICFTSGGSWTVQPTNGSVLTPTSAFQQPEEYYGSEGIEPVVIGREVIYVMTHAKMIRNISFNLYYNGYLGSEVSILSRHLFVGKNVIDMQYQQFPDSIVWFLMDDGSLVGLTYLREQEVVAFHRHDTNGFIESITCIPGDDYDELWITVKRANGRYVELLEQRLVDDVRESFFVDSGISYDNPVTITNIVPAFVVTITAPGHGFVSGDLIQIDDVVGTTELNGNRYWAFKIDNDNLKLAVIGNLTEFINGSNFGAYISGGVIRKCLTQFIGLDHLNGQTVSILADGFVEDQQVVTNGMINLSEAAAVCQIGLQYLSDLETLNVEIPNQQGTIQGNLVKIPSCVFRLVNSRGGWVGPSEFDEEGNLYLKESFIPDVPPTLAAPPLFTGDYKVEIEGNYENGGRIFYRQYDPLPVTIGALFLECEIGGLMP